MKRYSPARLARRYAKERLTILGKKFTDAGLTEVEQRRLDELTERIGHLVPHVTPVQWALLYGMADDLGPTPPPKWERLTPLERPKHPHPRPH